MDTGKNNQNKETSLYIRQNSISPAEVESTSQEKKSQLREEVLDTYLKFYSEKMETSFFSKNKMRFAFLGIIAFVLFLGTGSYILVKKNTQKSEDKVATTLKAEVTFMEGDVELMLEDGRWADIGDTTTLDEGDSIRIVGEGKSILTIDDGSAVRLGADTTVNLNSLDARDIVITNEGGEVYTRMNKSEREFTVKTSDASYKSLGTAYKTVQKKNEKGVFVYESKVQVDIEDTDSITVEEGEKLLLDSKKVAKLDSKDLEGDFIEWNKEQDKKEFGDELDVFKKKVEGEKSTKTTEAQKSNDPQPTPEPEAPASNPSISLGGNADANAGGIKLNWVPTDIDVSQGFKVVYSKTNSNPTFGVDQAIYIGDGNARNTFVQKNDGQTYYFRVCRYTGSGCDTYSNVMTITAPGQQAQGGVNSITLSAGGSNTVSWSINGTATQGVKVVYSKTAGPTYPPRGTDEAKYHSETGSSSSYLNPFSGAGTYYVRVCEYTGSSCNVYSNEVSITLN